jgi:hypothetical protein
LGLMKVIKLPENYYVPEKRVDRHNKQSFVAF